MFTAKGFTTTTVIAASQYRSRSARPVTPPPVVTGIAGRHAMKESSYLHHALALLLLGALAFCINCSSSDDGPTDPAGVWQWSSLGNGVGGTVYAVEVYGGEIYVGGHLSQTGDESLNFIRRWDGSNWVAAGGGLSYPVHAMTVYDGHLVAGGQFQRSDTLYVNFIAKWDGSSWTAFGDGLAVKVLALAVHDNLLYAGGYTNWPEPERYIGYWNGSAWIGIDSGTIGTVTDLRVYDGALHAAGSDVVGGMLFPFVKSWDGAAWTGLPDTSLGNVNSLCVYDSALIDGAEGSSPVRRFTGTGWTPVAVGQFTNSTFTPGVYDLAVHEDLLVVGGDFDAVAGVPYANIVAWDSSGWSAVGTGITGGQEPRVYALKVDGKKLYAGGRFTTAGGVLVNSIAEWSEK